MKCCQPTYQMSEREKRSKKQKQNYGYSKHRPHTRRSTGLKKGRGMVCHELEWYKEQCDTRAQCDDNRTHSCALQSFTLQGPIRKKYQKSRRARSNQASRENRQAIRVSSCLTLACLTASSVAVRAHPLHQQLGLLHVADTTIVSLFRQF